MATINFTNFIKDANAAAKRIASNPDVLGEFSPSQLKQLQVKLSGYSPVTEVGEQNRTKALNELDNRFGINDSNSAPVETVAQPAVEDKKGSEALSAGEQIAQHTVVLELHIHTPGFGRTCDPKQFAGKFKNGESLTDEEEQLDFKRFGVFQQIIGRDYLKPIMGHRNKFVGQMRELSVPSKFLANGHFLIPTRMISKVEDAIADFVSQRNELIDEFEAKYEEAKEEARGRLGIHYNESHYPTFSELREKFGVTSRWLSLNVPAALEKVNSEIYQREQEKAAMQWADTFDEVRTALRTGFVSLVDNFSNVLGNDEETGKPKIFQGSTVEKLKEFVRNFEDRNLTSDVELSALAAQARDLLNNVDPTGIRKDSDLRSNLNAAFAEIANKAKEMVTVQKRQLNFDE